MRHIAGRGTGLGFAVWLPILLTALFPANTPVLAGAAAGRIAGVLKDPSGAAVPGGQVSIQNLDSGAARSTTTDPQGRYVFDAVPPGRYQASAAASGFATSIRNDITVLAGRETDVGFELSIGKSTTVVRVTEPAATADSGSIVPARARTSDTASLLSGIPGVDLYDGGGVSSLPAIHGMADDRVNVLVNGMSVASACSNHMNPAMSYIDPANVGSASVMAGITPVSYGGDSIGGTIAIDSAAPEFAGPGQGVLTHGGVSAFHRSNGVVNGSNASLSIATGDFSFGYVGSYVDASDYKDGAGAVVGSTMYQSENHALQLAVRGGNSLLTVDLGYQHIPDQGFVNAHMDMVGNEAEFANLHYRGAFGWGRLDARVFYQHTTHEMNILRDKQQIMDMNMPMNTRGVNMGYSLKADIPLSGEDDLRAGNELHRFVLDDWWPAAMMMMGAMGPNTLWNINDGRRDVFGTYLEWEGKHGRGFTELLGIRSDVVLMNTGNVQGYNASATLTGSSAYNADATAFNSVSHSRLDANFDAAAMVRYEPDTNTTFELGYARKTRSPNLYERYLWVKQSAMSVDMNGWFGDLNGYAGNLNLRPEVANTASVTASLHDRARKRWELKITPYYTYIQDYIDAGRCPVGENGLGNGCSAARFNATSSGLSTVPYVTLQFGNYAAGLAGVDGSWRVLLGGNDSVGDFSLSGVAGYLHGKDTAAAAPGSPGQEPLYHMMPLNAKTALEHRRGKWSSDIGLQAVDAKSHVQAVRMELPTPGYALVNLRTSYRWRVERDTSLRLDAGIDNVAGRNYVLPLGGRYYGPTMAAIEAGASVPGMGRTFYAGLTFGF